MSRSLKRGVLAPWNPQTEESLGRGLLKGERKEKK